MLGQLGRRPALAADRREDHWPVTREAAAELANQPNDAVARRWWTEALGLIAACGELGPDQPVRYHHLAGSVRGLLVSRTFELWTHGDDIRQAVGLPFNLLDEGRLSLMVGELMGALPIGMALTGDVLPGRTARFIVTGTGGGTFDVPLDPTETPGVPDIVVTTDSIGLCRLAANRLHHGDLEAGVEGDASLLEAVLGRGNRLRGRLNLPGATMPGSTRPQACEPSRRRSSPHRPEGRESPGGPVRWGWLRQRKDLRPWPPDRLGHRRASARW